MISKHIQLFSLGLMLIALHATTLLAPERQSDPHQITDERNSPEQQVTLMPADIAPIRTLLSQRDRISALNYTPQNEDMRQLYDYYQEVMRPIEVMISFMLESEMITVQSQ